MAEKRTIELEVKENFKQVEKDLESLNQALDDTANSTKGVNATFEEVYGDLQPLTTRLGEAEDRLYELASAGDTTSKEYQNLLNKVSEYRKVQINTDLAVDAASSTMSQKLGGALSGVASGFEVAQGAMATFGVESQDIEKSLLKVQAAMALAQGIQGIRESANSFKALGTTAITAFNGMTKASKVFVASGIGLLITVLAIAANEMGVFTGKTEKQEQAEKKLEKETDALQKANDRYTESLNRQMNSIDKTTQLELALARQRGASQKELTQITRQGVLSRIQLLEIEQKAAAKAMLDASGSASVSEQQFAIIYNKNQGLIDQLKDARIQLAQVDADIAEQQRQAAASQAQTYQQQVQQATQTTVQIIDLRNEIVDEQIKLIEDENQITQTQLIVEAERRIKDIKNTVADKTQKAELIKAIQGNLIKELDKLDNEWYEKSLQAQKDADNAKLQAKLAFDNEIERITEENTLRNLSDQQKEIRAVNDKYFTLQELAKNDSEALKEIEIAKLNELNDINLKYQEIDFKNKEEAAAKEKARVKQLNDYRIKAAQDTLQVVSNLAELFAGKSEKQQKKAFQVQKAVNISNAVIDTYKAANVALASSPPPFNYIAMAAAITAGLVNVKKIASQQFQSSTTTPSGGSNAPTGAAPMTANFNTIGSSGINQLAQLQQQPTQAYVVSGEVTSAQALDRNRVQNATL